MSVRVDDLLRLSQSLSLRVPFPAATAAVVERLQVQPLLPKLVTELSGGERQRVLLAVALVREPELLLLDEPAAFVDATARQALEQELRLQQQAGTTVLLVTHDLAPLTSWASQVTCLRQTVRWQGPGKSLADARVMQSCLHGSDHD
jgi:ABC-type Mn2+/Zn2+ transport system ATPase subunit